MSEQNKGSKPFVKDWTSAIEFALSSRRGCLVMAAGIPVAEQLCDDDVKGLFGLLKTLIDRVSQQETKARSLQEIIESYRDSFNNVTAIIQLTATEADELLEEVS